MFRYFFLGIVQGITEFLPVSSSGHLAVFQSLFGMENPDSNLVLDVLLHFGTLLAVVWYFRSDLLPYFTRTGWTDPLRKKILFVVFLASIPTAAIGLGFKDFFESLFSSPRAVCGFFFLSGLFLITCDRLGRATHDIGEFSFWRTIILGIAQGIAVAPGVSRSGATIGTGILLGLSGVQAARVSFLLMIPAVGGATLLEARKIFKLGLPAGLEIWPLSVGMLASLVSGILALKLLNFILEKQRLRYFGYYLIAASICFLIALTTRSQGL